MNEKQRQAIMSMLNDLRQSLLSATDANTQVRFEETAFENNRVHGNIHLDTEQNQFSMVATVGPQGGIMCAQFSGKSAIEKYTREFHTRLTQWGLDNNPIVIRPKAGDTCSCCGHVIKEN